jgi:uncharacterized protein involved in exopolysaccharide biosynthesis
VTSVKRYLEIGFAHKLLLIAPVFAAVVCTAAYVMLQPAAYQSSATLWVNGNGVGTQSAAQSQADIVNQYLKTNSFALTVAQGPLTDYLNGHPSAVPGAGIRTQLSGLLGESGNGRKASDDGIRQYLAAHVTQTQLGPSELILTMSAPTPELAKGTADALITQLQLAEVAAKTANLQAVLTLLQTQLQDQSKVLSADLAAVRQYMADHPNLAKDAAAQATDSQLQVLKDAASVAQQTDVAILARIDQTQSDLELAKQSQPFRVADAPQLPSTQSLFGKQQIIAIGGGLLGGVFLVALMAALLIRLDTTIHSPEEVPAMVGMQVLGSTPLSARA